MEFDIRKTKEDITKFLILYEHRRHFVPINAEQFAESESIAIKRYQNDTHFHAKISMIVTHVMEIIRGNMK